MGTPALCADYVISKPSILALIHERDVQMRRQPLSSDDSFRTRNDTASRGVDRFRGDDFDGFSPSSKIAAIVSRLVEASRSICANGLGTLLRGRIRLDLLNPCFQCQADLVGDRAVVQLVDDVQLGTGRFGQPDGQLDCCCRAPHTLSKEHLSATTNCPIGHSLCTLLLNRTGPVGVSAYQVFPHH